MLPLQRIGDVLFDSVVAGFERLFQMTRHTARVTLEELPGMGIRMTGFATILETGRRKNIAGRKGFGGRVVAGGAGSFVVGFVQGKGCASMKCPAHGPRLPRARIGVVAGGAGCFPVRMVGRGMTGLAGGPLHLFERNPALLQGHGTVRGSEVAFLAVQSGVSVAQGKPAVVIEPGGGPPVGLLVTGLAVPRGAVGMGVLVTGLAGLFQT